MITSCSEQRTLGSLKPCVYMCRRLKRVTLWRRHFISCSRMNLFQLYPSVRGCGESCKHSKSLTYIAQPEELQIQNLLLLISCTELIHSLASHSIRYPSRFNAHIGFLCAFFFLHLSGGPGKIVRVKQVDVIPGSQQKTTSFLIQEQRVGVQAIRGTQKQG